MSDPNGWQQPNPWGAPQGRSIFNEVMGMFSAPNQQSNAPMPPPAQSAAAQPALPYPAYPPAAFGNLPPGFGMQAPPGFRGGVSQVSPGPHNYQPAAPAGSLFADHQSQMMQLQQAHMMAAHQEQLRMQYQQQLQMQQQQQQQQLLHALMQMSLNQNDPNSVLSNPMLSDPSILAALQNVLNSSPPATASVAPPSGLPPPSQTNMQVPLQDAVNTNSSNAPPALAAPAQSRDDRSSEIPTRPSKVESHSQQSQGHSKQPVSKGKKNYANSFARPSSLNSLQEFFVPSASLLSAAQAARKARTSLSQVQELMLALQPESDSAYERRETIRARWQAKLNHIIPGCILQSYGSSVTGMAAQVSDLDLCLKFDRSSGLANKSHLSMSHGEIVESIAEHLSGDQDVVADSLLALPKARVPIIKFADRSSGVHIDICIENELAPVNSQLIRAYGVFDPRVRPLVLAVKHFARQRNINEPYRGTLSSYGYVLLVIHFLQQRRPPVLPCLQELNRNQRPAQPRIAGFDVSYCDSNELAHQLFPTNNSASLSELLAEFFRYYAHEFDYHDSVISVRTGGLLSKSEKGWTSGGPRETDENADDAAADKAEQPRKGPPERTLFCIEDPFEVSHNLGRIVGRNQLHTIRGEFMRAWRIIVDGFEPVANIFQRI